MMCWGVQCDVLMCSIWYIIVFSVMCCSVQCSLSVQYGAL